MLTTGYPVISKLDKGNFRRVLVRMRLLLGTAVLAIASLFLLSGCDNSPEVYRWNGSTMGTHYSITVVGVGAKTVDSLSNGTDAGNLNSKTNTNLSTFSLDKTKQAVEKVLESVNASMSTYLFNSEISRFNRLDVQQCLVVSRQFMDVMQVSSQVYRASNGAFNPLVGSLVNRWGFGPSLDQEESGDTAFKFPSESEIKKIMLSLDMSSLDINKDNQSICKHANVTLDFSAVAKGYAVDKVAEALMALGVENYLVDIGGELRVLGHNSSGEPWRLAIEQPQLARDTVQQIIAMTRGAIATSGDYRNFFIHEGQRYSHTIDPRTGFPVTHGLTSVSVIAASAAEADAWATALSVLGPQEAKQVIVEYQLAVFLVERNVAESLLLRQRGSTEVTYETWYSNAFASYLSH